MIACIFISMAFANSAETKPHTFLGNPVEGESMKEAILFRNTIEFRKIEGRLKSIESRLKSIETEKAAAEELKAIGAYRQVFTSGNMCSFTDGNETGWSKYDLSINILQEDCKKKCTAKGPCQGISYSILGGNSKGICFEWMEKIDEGEQSDYNENIKKIDETQRKDFLDKLKIDTKRTVFNCLVKESIQK